MKQLSHIHWESSYSVHTVDILRGAILYRAQCKGIADDED